MTNSLLSDWDTPFGLPPFNQISDEDFSPAFDTALEKARAQIAAIAENPEPPSMANTIDALEKADEGLSRVLSAFFTLVSTSANPKLEASATRIFTASSRLSLGNLHERRTFRPDRRTLAGPR